MAGVFKRQSDKARGKAGKWTAWWYDHVGVKHMKVAFTDKGESIKFAREQEALAKRGLVAKTWPQDINANVENFAGFHAEANSRNHTLEIRNKLVAVFGEAGIVTLAGIDVPLIQSALSSYCEGKSNRTYNKTLGFVRSFVTWLDKMGRIDEYPKGMDEIRKLSQTERVYDRRALTASEEGMLLWAARDGGDYVTCRGPSTGNHHVQAVMTGPDREMLYRLALGTGFRAGEIGSLTPARFHLDSPEPTVTVLASYTKNKKEALLPITNRLAKRLWNFLSDKEDSEPVFKMPSDTSKMMKVDLAAAGIPVVLDGKVLDFHALRHTYITNLVAAGVNPKVVQLLARHSSIQITMDRYCHVQPGDLRRAIDKMEGR